MSVPMLCALGFSMQKGKQNADFLQMKKTKTPQRLSMGTVGTLGTLGTLCAKLSASQEKKQQKAQGIVTAMDLPSNLVMTFHSTLTDDLRKTAGHTFALSSAVPLFLTGVGRRYTLAFPRATLRGRALACGAP